MKKNPTRHKVIGGFSPTDLIQKSSKKKLETPVKRLLDQRWVPVKHRHFFWGDYPLVI